MGKGSFLVLYINCSAESHTWYVAQGIHLQMKHLGDSPEFQWGKHFHAMQVGSGATLYVYRALSGTLYRK